MLFFDFVTMLFSLSTLKM